LSRLHAGLHPKEPGSKKATPLTKKINIFFWKDHKAQQQMLAE